MASDRRGGVAGLVKILVIAGALLFAVQGGEFGTLDLIRQRRTKARLTHEIDSLRRVVDTLQAYDAKVEHDPATQERIAREVFGMVRGNKELLYRFTTPLDSGFASRDSARRKPK
ncbi:MAG: septum formation initiator family protein [Gemmatimonadales bacterium]